MKNWNINTSFFKSLWEDKSAKPGITWFAVALETDRKSILCYLCIISVVIFDIEIKKNK